jgi:hypothetical protein
MRITVVALVLSFLALLAACTGEAPPPEGAAASKHAPEQAKPGSHEDWCGEHEVPESMCTRCNPALVAAFKATGDWCAEHDLPESQCRLCNPDLKIERPPKEGGP